MCFARKHLPASTHRESPIQLRQMQRTGKFCSIEFSGWNARQFSMHNKLALAVLARNLRFTSRTAVHFYFFFCFLFYFNLVCFWSHLPCLAGSCCCKFVCAAGIAHRIDETQPKRRVCISVSTFPKYHISLSTDSNWSLLMTDYQKHSI